MAEDPKIKETIEKSARHPSRVRRAAELQAAIDQSLRLPGVKVSRWSQRAKETRDLAERVENPGVKNLLLEIAEIQDRMAGE